MKNCFASDFWVIIKIYCWEGNEEEEEVLFIESGVYWNLRVD